MEINEYEFWDFYGPFKICERPDEVEAWDKHVWTVVESGNGDDYLYALPGYHRVNAVFWVKSTEPWSSEETTGVWFTPLDIEV